jgi:hypothetical protein
MKGRAGHWPLCYRLEATCKFRSLALAGALAFSIGGLASTAPATAKPNQSGTGAGYNTACFNRSQELETHAFTLLNEANKLLSNPAATPAQKDLANRDSQQAEALMKQAEALSCRRPTNTRARPTPSPTSTPK